MKRWAVRKLHPHACGPDGTAWVAGEVGKWQNTVCSFRTWAKAMAYADRKSRLAPDITIEDPSGALCDLTATVDSWHFIHLKAGDDTFDLARHEWRPLAYFLLGAAKHQKEE